MNKYGLMLVLWMLGILLGGKAILAEDREVIFSDDFAYKDPAELAKKWSAFSGHWFIKDGTLHQDSGEYDYGIVVRDLYLRCDYRVQTKVRLVSGGPGAGLYWNVFDQGTGENGHMLRYDGTRPIMYGWMGGRGFLGTGGATGNLTIDGKFHDLRMDVKNTAGTFDVYWEGRKIVTDAPLYYRGGYVGLECSMGHSEFKDVQISVAKGVDWRAAPKGAVCPEWVSSVAVLPNGDLVYPVRNMHKVQIVTPRGKLVREFGKFGTGQDELKEPMTVAVGPSGDIYVVETGNNRVQVFNSSGKSVRLLAPSGNDVLNKPLGLAVCEPERKLGGDSEEDVWVSDAGNRVVRVSSDGNIVTSIGTANSRPGQFKSPMHLWTQGDKLYVADSGSSNIQVFDPPSAAALPVAPVSIAYNGKDRWVAAYSGGIVTLDKDLKPLKTFTGKVIGGMRPEQAVFDRQGNIVVADGRNHRLVILPGEPNEVTVAVTNITDTSAVVTWNSDTPTPSRLMLLDTPVGATLPPSADFSKGRPCGDGKMETDHRIELTDLKPGSRYVFAISSPVQTIPAVENVGCYRFTTAPAAGKTAYSEVPVAVLCYGNVTFNDQKGADGKVPPPVVRDQRWFDHNIEVHEAVRYFYWTNSFFRLDTKFKYLFVTRTVDFSFLGSSSEEVVRDLEELAKREKMKPQDFGAVILIGGNGTYAYPWPTPWSGGKLTYTTGCCFAGGGDVWLSTHEFHHLTEGWMSMIGERRYTCADTPWKHPYRIGEHFDFLASTLRCLPGETYLNLAVGAVKSVDDKDGDGVPDNDPTLVWDEKRAGTGPNNTESYQNGLTDLQNLTAETFHPAVRGQNHPLRAWKVDFKYPFAVLDYDYERHMKSPAINGVLSEKDWDVFTRTPNAIVPNPASTPLGKPWKPIDGASYKSVTYLNWDKDNLYFAAKAPFKLSVSLELDCDGDGFFKGNDNVKMILGVPADESKTPAGTIMQPPDVQVWNNVEPVQAVDMPNWTNERFTNKDKIKWTWGKTQDGWYFIQAAVPRTEMVRLLPAEGKEIGVMLQVWSPGPAAAGDKVEPKYVFQMFDIYEYGYVKLVK